MTNALRQRTLLLALAAIMLHCPGAIGQEAMYTGAATMPSPGVITLRPQVLYSEYGFNPNTGAASTSRLVFDTSLQIGLARGLSLTIDAPVEVERARFPGGATESDQGVSNIDFTLKWRFYQNDSGGIDTVRAALLAGVKTPSGDDHDFSTESFNPHLGAVLTVVRGRHGVNFELDYQFNTGGSDLDNLAGGEGAADAFRYNASYLFRLIPERYTSATNGAWYATIEVNGLYETNGDNEIRWSPGIMFEHRDFALEFMAQLPLVHNLEHRPELDFSFGVGVRFTF